MKRSMNISTSEKHVWELIEKARQGETVRMIGVGNSMSPFLKDGRDFIDLIAVSPETKLSKNDVILYRSHEGKYVLHRIHEVTKEGYYPVGDGNITVEPLLESENIYLKAVGFLIRGRYVSAGSKLYRCYAGAWTKLFPVRRRLLRWFRRLDRAISIFRREIK